MKRGFIVIVWFHIFGILVPCSFAQQENVWVFGNYAGLDFNAGAPEPIGSSIHGALGEANASVCDASGQLLFYTEGTIVWDKNGNIMPNGAALIDYSPNSNNLTPTNSSCQGALIMPVPESETQYYIFSLTSAETDDGRLYYSVVDMALNGGWGDVVSGQKGILVDSGLSEKMTAVTGNHCDVWLVVRARLNNTFKAYRVSGSGVSPSSQQSSVGTMFGGLYTGQMVISPNRRKLVICNAALLFGLQGGVELYDFDPATGTVSNPVAVTDSTGYYGAAFSPDNSKLYVSTIAALYQFDLNGPDMTPYMVGPCSFSQIKLAPDGKIYCRAGGNNWSKMSVVNYPDLAGANCQYIPAALALLQGTSMLAGLPNVVPVIPHDTSYSRQALAAPCFGGGFALTAAGTDTGWDYVWNTGAVTTSISPTSPGTYWVSYRTPPCNYHADTFAVTFPNGVLPTVAIDTACAGATNGGAHAYTYPGDTVVYHYAWLNNADDTLSLTGSLTGVPGGTYVLHIATAACDTILMVTIPVIEDGVSFTVPDTLVCTDELLTFQNTSAPGYNSFVWQFGDGNISEASSPAYQYENSGAYTACLIGQGSICSDTACRVILVDAPVDSFRFQPDRALLCSGQHIMLNAVTDSTLTGYDWNFGDDSDFQTSDHITEHAYDKEGVYLISLKGRFRACPDQTVTDTIHIYPLPEVQLSPDSALCLGGSPIRLENRIADTGTCHYEWSTGDTAAGIEIRHPGIYSLTVTQEPAGCATTDAVTVSKDCYIDIPNAFTPNGDGANDYFFPRQYLSKSVIQFRMQVLNRWGQKIFETTSIEGRGWDGCFNGKEQPAGVYVYMIDVTLAGDRQEHYEGNVTLMR